MNTVTFASHNQRGVGTILIEVPEKEYIDGEKLIEIIESSMSSPISELLKRPDENAVVMNAHKNPVFVEESLQDKKTMKVFTDTMLMQKKFLL